MKRKILVIDDKYEEFLDEMKNRLGSDYEVIPTRDDKEAFQILSQDGISVVLLDLYWGKENPYGLDILGVLGEEYPDLPIVMLTIEHDVDRSVWDQCKKKGAHFYLDKYLMWDNNLLRDTIERAIRWHYDFYVEILLPSELRDKVKGTGLENLDYEAIKTIERKFQDYNYNKEDKPRTLLDYLFKPWDGKLYTKVIIQVSGGPSQVKNVNLSEDAHLRPICRAIILYTAYKNMVGERSNSRMWVEDYPSTFDESDSRYRRVVNEELKPDLEEHNLEGLFDSEGYGRGSTYKVRGEINFDWAS